MELHTSLDWQNIKTELQRLARMLPEFSHDFYRVTINLESLVKELGNLEVVARQKKTHAAKDACKKKVKHINEELYTIKKIHLMSVLSR